MKKLGTLIMIALCVAIATPAALAMTATASIQIDIAAPAAPTVTSNNPGPDFEAYYVAEQIMLTATPDNSASYIWYKDGVPIPNETGNTLTIASATDDDNGDYTVAAVNECSDESAASNAITVTVYDRVTVEITAESVPEVTEGESDYPSCSAITLTANVPGTLYGPLTYQWRMGETPIQDADEATYLITPATSSQSGNYNVVVTDAMGRDPMTP